MIPAISEKNSKQSGLSLVELMITLVIASILVLAIMQIFADNKTNQLFQQNQVANVNNSRFALLILDSILENVGYRRAPDDSLEAAFPLDSSVTGCSTFASGAAITTLSTANTIGFCMRYQPTFSGDLDCTGNAIVLSANDNTAFKSLGGANMIVQAVRFVPGENNRLEAGRLECTRIRPGTTPAFVEIASGIADFRVNFGVGDLQNNSVREITQYVAADAWSQSTHGDPLAIQYEALLASLPNQREGASLQLDRWKELASEAALQRLVQQDDDNLYQISSNSNAIRNLTR